MYYSALIGNPTGHSVSHILYEELAKAANLNDSYRHLKINVTEPGLKDALQAFKALNFIGLNVTLPHKLAVVPLLDQADEVVGEIGAVNTIKLGGTSTGYNTDWVGLYVPLRPLIRDNDHTATILGSGGAARAAIYAAKQLKFSTINVVYRDEPNNDKTADLKARAAALGIKLHTYEDITALIGNSQLIINATSAGMVGKDKLPFDLKEITDVSLHNKVYFDAVFNPLETPLLAHFKRNGAQTIDGLWMMMHQGIAALEIWLDKKLSFTEEELRRIHARLAKELQHV
jgi:shikimate dehydrogenase